jgi:8-oxo-dGTP pyrophosphatase MutT (NUDIX family)
VNPRHRISTRALIVTPENKFLLFLSHFDPGSGLPPQWVFPGGGLETGEEPLEGIIREVFEETGKIFNPADFLEITRIHHLMDDVRLHDSGEAHFFELRVSEPFEPSSENWTENEHRDTVMHRWLTLDEAIGEQLWIGPQGAIDLLIERSRNQGL